MVDTPSREQLLRVLSSAIRTEQPGRVAWVIAHGSWVRQDFWAADTRNVALSDIDLIVVGPGQHRPEDVAAALYRDKSLKVNFDAWPTSEQYLNEVRNSRQPDLPILPWGNGIFDINGFDLVEHHDVLHGDPLSDPLKNFPVPRGRDLARVCLARLGDLERELGQGELSEQRNRIACDALKVATVLFSILRGMPPTRNKNELLELFLSLVPNFDRRDAVATEVWRLYRAGERDGGAAHRRSCEDFVHLLSNVARAAWVAG